MRVTGQDPRYSKTRRKTYECDHYFTNPARFDAPVRHVSGNPFFMDIMAKKGRTGTVVKDKNEQPEGPA